MAAINTVEVGAVEWNASFAIAGLDGAISAGITTGATFSAFAAARGVLLAPVGAGSAQATDSETTVDLTGPISAAAVLAALATARAALTAATSASATQLSDVEVVAAILGSVNATATLTSVAPTVASIQAASAAGATWAARAQAAATLLMQTSAGMTSTSRAQALAAVTVGIAASAALTGRTIATEYMDEFYVDLTEAFEGETTTATTFAALIEQAVAGMAIEGELTGFAVTLLAGAAAGAAFTSKIATVGSWAAGAAASAEFSLPAEVRMLVATIALLARVAASSITLHQTTDLSAVSARYRVIEEE